MSEKFDVIVVGAGPAGMACAATAAERGHEVTLFATGDSQTNGRLVSPWPVSLLPTDAVIATPRNFILMRSQGAAPLSRFQCTW